MGRASLALLLLAAALASPAPTRCRAASSKPLRLIDTAPNWPRRREIDGWRKRILDSSVARQEFPIDAAPAEPRLRFSVGIVPSKDEEHGKVRFTIELHREGRKIRDLYKRELTSPGWVDDEIDLGVENGAGARLVFVKTSIEGSKEFFRNAYWAEPILLRGKPERGTSVVLVSIDTLRADHVGIYGDAGARTPALDALARQGVWYSTAYSASSWTVPSHQALLHGMFPWTVRGPRAKGPPPPGAVKSPSLGELFGAAGFLTAGFTGGGYLTYWGFPVGFDTFFTYSSPPTPGERCPESRFDGQTVFGHARRWLRANAERPFFLFVHTYDVHDHCPVTSEKEKVKPMEPRPDPGPEGRRRLIRYYDDMVARIDSLLAGLLQEIDSAGLSDRVVVAVTSDHGEAFWEHGFYGHGCWKPYEEIVRVPLILRAPGRPQPGRIDQPVSAIDVAPTLLALAGVPRPPQMQGEVLPGLGIEGRSASTPIYVSCEGDLAVRIGTHKLISTTDPHDSDELYDLASDPGETKNLIDDERAIATYLGELAREHAQHVATTASDEREHLENLDEKTRERLRALGYLE